MHSSEPEINQETLRVALNWREQGIVAIPCYPGSKRPVVKWGEWQQKLPPVALLRQWFGHTLRNIALVCGGHAGLVVLDFDDVAAFAAWRSHWPVLAGSFMVRTVRGYHVYLHCWPQVACFAGKGVELKGRGGLVLTPPSMHPTGQLYRVYQVKPILTVAAADLVAILGIGSAGCVVGGDSPHTEFISPPSRSNSPNGCTLLRQDLIGKVKLAVSILNLVSRYTRLVRSSRDGRWYAGRCPFHDDGKPSFWVDIERGMCGCRRPDCAAGQPGGRVMDIFNFYARIHGCSNSEAIEALAREAGLWQ